MSQRMVLRSHSTQHIMLTFIRFSLTLALIILIVPQTNTENIMLRAFNNSNLFKSYGEAKHFLRWLTWTIIAMYLLVTYLAA